MKRWIPAALIVVFALSALPATASALQYRSNGILLTSTPLKVTFAGTATYETPIGSEVGNQSFTCSIVGAAKIRNEAGVARTSVKVFDSNNCNDAPERSFPAIKENYCSAPLGKDSGFHLTSWGPPKIKEERESYLNFTAEGYNANEFEGPFGKFARKNEFSEPNVEGMFIGGSHAGNGTAEFVTWMIFPCIGIEEQWGTKEVTAGERTWINGTKNGLKPSHEEVRIQQPIVGAFKQPQGSIIAINVQVSGEQFNELITLE